MSSATRFQKYKFGLLVAQAGLASAAHAAPPPCPIEAPALARLRAEHAAMDAAGVACLDALDATRAERDRCTTLAVGRLADLAGAAAAQVDHLEALTQALDRPPEAVATARPWALVGLGGALVAGTAVGASALGASTSEMAGATLGAAAVGAAVAMVVTWATGG